MVTHGGSWRSPTTSVMPRPDSSVVERGPEKAGGGGWVPPLARPTITPHYASQSRGLCSAQRHSCGSLLNLRCRKTGSNCRHRPFQGCLAMQLSHLESAEMIDVVSLTG